MCAPSVRLNHRFCLKFSPPIRRCRRCAVAPSVHLLHRFGFEYIFLLLLLLFRRPPFAERNVKDAGVGIDSRGARRWTKP